MTPREEIGSVRDVPGAGQSANRTMGALDSQSSAGAVRERPLSKAVGKAYEYIRVRILDGRLPPSSHLVEHVLAREIQVSRTPVREALRRLASDGFVSFVPNLGAKVVEWPDQSFADLIHVRSTLAGMAAALAAPRIGSTALGELRELNAELARAVSDGSPDALLEAARLTHAIHRVVFDASGNQWLRQLLDQTAYLPMIHRTHFVFDAHAWQGAIARYESLIEALAARDAEWASTLMRAHFLTAKHEIRQHFFRAPGSASSSAS